ncbi:hypothetical protein [Polaromonas sp.]|uniref:hypothetical protein n=1 Tax=Polaromonas sp. TaxID=1869339 RepID=UPI003BAB2D88
MKVTKPAECPQSRNSWVPNAMRTPSSIDDRSLDIPTVAGSTHFSQTPDVFMDISRAPRELSMSATIANQLLQPSGLPARSQRLGL